jgi:hypothetical protein
MKEKLEQIQVADEDSCLECLQEILRILIKKNLMTYLRLRYSGFKK